MAYKKEQWMLGNNPDPSKYEDIHTNAGWYRRKKKARGSIVNAIFKKNAANLPHTLAAADYILSLLEPWLLGLELWTLRMKLSGALLKSINQSKSSFTFMKGIDIQPYRKMQSLLHAKYSSSFKNDQIITTIELNSKTIDLHNSIATDFYFDAIILSGDPFKQDIKIDSAESMVYPIENTPTVKCEIMLNLSENKVARMVLLKVSCIEGNEFARSARHYAMKVIAVSP